MILMIMKWVERHNLPIINIFTEDAKLNQQAPIALSEVWIVSRHEKK